MFRDPVCRGTGRPRPVDLPRSVFLAIEPGSRTNRKLEWAPSRLWEIAVDLLQARFGIVTVSGPTQQDRDRNGAAPVWSPGLSLKFGFVGTGKDYPPRRILSF